MLIKFLHGLAVLMALLVSFCSIAHCPIGAERRDRRVATFASRFSALTDAPRRRRHSATAQRPASRRSIPYADAGAAVRPQRDAGDRGEVLEQVEPRSSPTSQRKRNARALSRPTPRTARAAAKKFLDVIADGRAHDGRARIGVINRAINLAIRPTSDLAQWGVADRWSAPLETLASGRGDCEDYAIAKYVALARSRDFRERRRGSSSCATLRMAMITRSLPPASTRRG